MKKLPPCPAALLIAVSALLWPTLGHAGPPGLTAHDLARMDRQQLDAVFTAATIGQQPVGAGRGKVLLVVEAHSPRGRAAMMSSVWKGKYFHPDGCFTNMWLGFKAVDARSYVGTSLLDGAPCFAVDYAADAPVFGGTRDELREVAQGVFLGRFYYPCPCRKLKGYFVLTFSGCGTCP